MRGRGGEEPICRTQWYMCVWRPSIAENMFNYRNMSSHYIIKSASTLCIAVTKLLIHEITFNLGKKYRRINLTSGIYFINRNSLFREHHAYIHKFIYPVIGTDRLL